MSQKFLVSYCKEAQYENSDQLFFLRNLRELQCTYSVVHTASVFQSCRKVRLAILAPKKSSTDAMTSLSLENCVSCKCFSCNKNRHKSQGAIGCSSVLSGISGQLLQRLQPVFNAAARLVFSARKSEHITPLLRELHWLKVPERIQFRLCVLAYRCLTGTAPSYLTETLRLTADVGSRRRLRSASKSTLVIPTT